MKKYFNRIWEIFFAKIEDPLIKELNRIIGTSCDSLLDVGCGFDSPVQHLRCRPRYIVGIDYFSDAIEQSHAKGLHDKYYRISILDVGNTFEVDSFYCVLALEVIEHLNKKDAVTLISYMEKLAQCKVIISTPNGFFPQGEEFGNPYQKHLSGWTVREMEAMGYSVIGLGGLKWLRGEKARMRWFPRPFWRIVSLFSQLYVRNHPEYAFRILCFKEKNDSRVESSC